MRALSVFLLAGCLPKPVLIGIIDAKEDTVCALQLPDETIIYVDSRICENVKEGDVIGVIHEVQ